MLRQTACFHLSNGTEMQQIGTFGAPCPYAEEGGGEPTTAGYGAKANRCRPAQPHGEGMIEIENEVQKNPHPRNQMEHFR